MLALMCRNKLIIFIGFKFNKTFGSANRVIEVGA